MIVNLRYLIKQPSISVWETSIKPPDNRNVDFKELNHLKVSIRYWDRTEPLAFRTPSPKCIKISEIKNTIGDKNVFIELKRVSWLKYEREEKSWVAASQIPEIRS